MRSNSIRVVALLLASAVLGAGGWFVADAVFGSDEQGTDPVCEALGSMSDLVFEWNTRSEEWNSMERAARLESIDDWKLSFDGIRDEIVQIELTALELSNEYTLASILQAGARSLASSMTENLDNYPPPSSRSGFGPNSVGALSSSNSDQLRALEVRCSSK